jgi:arsenate reductase
VSKRILFLCTGNSCRSQIAEALWRELAGPEWEAHSAGSSPAGFVHPLAVQVMAERGIDLDDARSKSIDGFLGEPMDLVVTVCDGARDACPALPGARRTLHWPFDDPAEAAGSPDEQRETFRRVRDEIEAAIRVELQRGSESGDGTDATC